MLKAQFQVFKKYTDLLKNLVGRDLTVKYRRSALGIAWSLLKPVLMALVLGAVFSMLLNPTMEHFTVYLICGQQLYSFFNEATTGAMFSIIDSSALIKKVYIPKYIFPLEKALFAFVNLLYSLAAILVMMIISGVPLHWNALLFPVPLVLLLVFAIGIGMLLASICVFFRDLRHLYEVFLLMWMYLTPIFYERSMLGDGLIGKVVDINPLTWYLTYFRDVVLFGKLPTLEMNLVCLAYSVGAFLIGVLVFRARQDKFILHI